MVKFCELHICTYFFCNDAPIHINTRYGKQIMVSFVSNCSCYSGCSEEKKNKAPLLANAASLLRKRHMENYGDAYNNDVWCLHRDCWNTIKSDSFKGFKDQRIPIDTLVLLTHTKCVILSLFQSFFSKSKTGKTAKHRFRRLAPNVKRIHA